jgi:hypothetical protein
VMMMVKRFECVILENESQLFCRMVVGVPVKDENLFIEKVKDFLSISLSLIDL